MKKIVFWLVSGVLFTNVLLAQPSKLELLGLFERWESSSSSASKLIKYVKVGSLLTPNSVIHDDIDDTFTDGIYENTFGDTDLAALADADGDGTDEAFVLLIQGSGRFPVFYGFKKDTRSGKFRRVLTMERYIEPAELGGEIYFVEAFRAFNSGRWPTHQILKMKSDMTLAKIAEITTSYTYRLNPDVARYISSDQLNQIAEQDYSFLGIQEKQPTDFILAVDGKSVQAHIKWTSVGYFATTVDVTVTDYQGLTRKFEQLWGFSVKRLGQQSYLCTLLMDDENRVSAIQDFRVNIYRMSDWKLVASQFASASEVNSVK